MLEFGVDQRFDYCVSICQQRGDWKHRETLGVNEAPQVMWLTLVCCHLFMQNKSGIMSEWLNDASTEKSHSDPVTLHTVGGRPLWRARIVWVCSDRRWHSDLHCLHCLMTCVLVCGLQGRGERTKVYQKQKGGFKAARSVACIPIWASLFEYPVNQSS